MIEEKQNLSVLFFYNDGGGEISSELLRGSRWPKNGRIKTVRVGV